MSGFHEVRFRDNIASGATGGPEFATTVVATGAGHEKRNVNWSEARGRWELGNNVPVYVVGSQAIPPALGDSGKAIVIAITC
jgi:hypothetical protein